jgi:hypothetical protein
MNLLSIVLLVLSNLHQHTFSVRVRCTILLCLAVRIIPRHQASHRAGVCRNLSAVLRLQVTIVNSHGALGVNGVPGCGSYTHQLFGQRERCRGLALAPICRAAHLADTANAARVSVRPRTVAVSASTQRRVMRVPAMKIEDESSWAYHRRASCAGFTAEHIVKRRVVTCSTAAQCRGGHIVCDSAIKTSDAFAWRSIVAAQLVVWRLCRRLSAPDTTIARRIARDTA